MKRGTFIGWFIGIHLGFIFLQIHKQSFVIRQTYQKQKNEKLKEALREQKKELSQELIALQDHATIKQFAQDTLGMKKIAFKQIKRIDYDPQS